jgi:hypothetical protein
VKNHWILPITLMLVLVACGPTATPVELNTNSPPSPTPAATKAGYLSTSSITMSPTSDQLSSTMPSNPSQFSPDEQKMVDLSRKNLSQKLKINIDQIVLASIKKVTWRDASLGCPKPGIDYIRVETTGYSIMLEAEGKTYNYHTDESKRVVLCHKQ